MILQIIQTKNDLIAVSDEMSKSGDLVFTDYGNIAKCTKAQCDDERYLAVNNDNVVLKSACKKIILTDGCCC